MNARGPSFVEHHHDEVTVEHGFVRQCVLSQEGR
jgi:hypothetical protein